MDKQKKSFKNSPVLYILIFLIMAGVFSVFRDPIGEFAKVCLILTGEITPRKVKSTKVVAMQKDIAQIKFAQKAIKAKYKQKKSTKSKPKKLHGERTKPAREAFYLAPGEDVSDDAKLYLTRKEQVVYKPENWKGKQDSAAIAWVRRTDKGIVVTVEVQDDCLRGDASSPWQNDSVEIYFDARPAASRGDDKYEQGVFQAIAVPKFAKQGPDKVTFYFGGGTSRPVPGTKMKSWINEGKGYGVSVFFPYEGLKKSHFIPEDEFNLDIAINDFDSGSEDRSQMIWSGTSDNCRGPKWFGRLKPLRKKN